MPDCYGFYHHRALVTEAWACYLWSRDGLPRLSRLFQLRAEGQAGYKIRMISENYLEAKTPLSARRFSVAPMMDGSGKSKKSVS
jgi:hypothetical protein